LREKRQEVKEEHNTIVPKGEDHFHFDADVYEYWMETTANP
jgi:hypothetical protein